jgi:hypothetical protein
VTPARHLERNFSAGRAIAGLDLFTTERDQINGPLLSLGCDRPRSATVVHASGLQERGLFPRGNRARHAKRAVGFGSRLSGNENAMHEFPPGSDARVHDAS